MAQAQNEVKKDTKPNTRYMRDREIALAIGVEAAEIYTTLHLFKGFVR